AIAQNEVAPGQYVLDLVPQVFDVHAAALNLQGAASDLNAVTSDLSDNARKLIEANDRIMVRKDEGGTVLSVASDILFAFDSANLSPKAQATLKDISTIINDSQVQ